MKNIKDFNTFSGTDGYLIVDGLTNATPGGKIQLSKITLPQNPSAWTPEEGTEHNPPEDGDKWNLVLTYNNSTYSLSWVPIIPDTPPSPSYNYIILQNFLDGHTIGTPISGGGYSDFYNTYPTDISLLWYSESDWSDTNLVSTTAGSQLLYSENGFDFSKYELPAGQIPFGFCKGYDVFNGAGYDNITLPSNWTIESWFYSPAINDNNQGWYGSFFDIGPNSSDTISLFINSGSISLHILNNQVLEITKNVAVQTWHHIALSCDGTNLYLLYDGELLGTVAIASVSGLSAMLASAVKVLVNVDSNGYGCNAVWYAQLALCDECKWTNDYDLPKVAY